MGVLFWVLAVFTVALPRSGKWMESVKSVGGIALIGVALYFLRPVVPALARFVDTSQAFLVGAVAAVVVGFAIGAAHLSFKGTGAAIRLRKALGVVLVAGGGFAAVNWAVTADRHLPWRTDEAAAFAEAREQGKGVMVDFAAEWCTPCLQLENTFAAPGVYEEIVGGYIPLRLDVTRQNDANDELQARFNATTLPAVIFLDAERNELARVSAYVGPDDFLEVIEAAGEAARKRAQAP
jgi:thiol:disulfide interchange protein DsbD